MSKDMWLPAGATGYEVDLAGHVRRKGSTRILKTTSSGGVCLNLGAKDMKMHSNGTKLARAAVASMPWRCDNKKVETR